MGWLEAIGALLGLLPIFLKWWGNKEKMSELMFEWLKKHRLTDHVRSFMDAEKQNQALDQKPFEETP